MDKNKRKIDICVFSVFVAAAFAFVFFAMFDPYVFEDLSSSGEKVSDLKEVGGVLAFLLAVSGFNVYIATKRSA